MFETQKKEAIKRMKILSLHENVIKEFKEEEVVNKSELGGFLYWLNKDEARRVKQWEDDTGNLAYHAIFNKTKFGDMLSVLYVSKHKSEWEMDNEDIENGYSYAYVINLENPSFNEIGSIAFEKKIGGLVRIG